MKNWTVGTKCLVFLKKIKAKLLGGKWQKCAETLHRTKEEEDCLEKKKIYLGGVMSLLMVSLGNKVEIGM